MNTQTEFRRYIEENEQLPPDCVLGHIAWFTVEDALYDAAELEQRFAAHGLDPGLLPPQINPTDAYEKASKSVSGFRYEVAGGNTAEIMVREVARTGSQIVRNLTREVKDAKGRNLLYDKVGELVFYKAVTRRGNGPGGRTVDPASVRCRASLEPNLHDSEKVVLDTVVHQFQTAYDRHCRYHDGQKLRAVMRAYLAHLNAVQMKPSVYFVHATRAAELASLRTFAAEYDSLSLTTLPLADLPSLREDVTDAFQAEAEKELGLVVAEITKLRTERKKISPAAYAKVREQYDQVLIKANEYSRLLHVSQDRTAGAAETASAALLTLQRDFMTQLEAS